MHRLMAAILLLLVGAAAGTWLPPLIAGSRAQGADVRCVQVGNSTICKGQSIKEIPWNFHRNLGGIVGIFCDYERPGKARENGNLLDIPSLVSGCNADRYAVSLSSGVVLTNFWIEDGLIVQIDRFNANPIDL